jgi:hypothetical protein
MSRKSDFDRNAAIEKILDTVDKLNPENKQKFIEFMEELHHESLRERLDMQYLPNRVNLDELWNYVCIERKNKRDETMLMLNIFEYGRIYGIRSERARRARKDISNCGLLVRPE